MARRFLIAPLAAFVGAEEAVVIWVLFWLVPTLTALPVLRSIAEAEEHDYARGGTEFESTFTNHGPIHEVLLHPNDAYHLIHHMFPNIPVWRHHKVHKLLMEYDEKYRRSLFRTRILTPPPST